MIKKYILIFMIFFSSNLSSYAQDYIPIIQEGSFWEVTESGPGSCAYINRYRVGDGFNYNSKVYKNIEVAPFREEDDPNDLCHPVGNMYVNENEFTPSSSYLREDINEKKLYSIIGKEMSFQFSEENQEIDISHLNQGVYFLKI
jgi:hypothetical protein